MCSFRFTISTYYRKTVEKQLKTAQQMGDLDRVKYLLTILAVMDGQPSEKIAQCLRLQTKTVKEWVRLFCCYGTQGAPSKRRSQQPKVPTSGKGYKVLGLIDYFSGRFFYQGHEGRLDTLAYLAFLTQVLAHTTQPLVLMQDGARYYTSKAAQAFFAGHADRLTVFQLPSYSPDDNPIEKLWKKVKQQDTPLHYFPNFAALTTRVEEALLKFANAPQEILALCSLPSELAFAA